MVRVNFDKVVNIQPTDPKETEENNNETWNGVENGDHVIAKENSGVGTFVF